MKQIQDRNYEPLQTLGKGNFGTIIKVKDKTSGAYYACKIQKKKDLEIFVKKQFQSMRQMESTSFFPKMIEYWQDKSSAYLVMELLGATIEQKKAEKGRLDMRTVSLIAKQIFDILQCCHSYGIIHRDIKPQNILLSSNHKICLIDFGLSKRCNNSLPPKTQKLIGNVRFASRDAHLGDSHKKGDLQSACYMLLYLFTGSLPWQKLPISAVQVELDRINSYSKQPEMTQLLKIKYDLNIDMFEKHQMKEKLFLQQLISITYYVQNLETKMNINYAKLKQKVERLMFVGDAFNNKCFDWCESSCSRAKETTLKQLWDVVRDIESD